MNLFVSALWLVATIFMMCGQMVCLSASIDAVSKQSVFVSQHFVTAKIKYLSSMHQVVFPAKIIVVILIVACTGATCGYLTWDRANTPVDAFKLMIAFVCISSIAITDYKERIIPNIIPIAMIAARIAFFIIEFFSRNDDFFSLLVGSLVGGGIPFIVLYVLSMLTHGGLGLGDVKLFGALGFLCGLYAVVCTLFYALVACVVVSVVLLVLRKKGMKDKLAFGPFILAGFFFALILGTF
jgi:leader peptidase (prepilin peptidase)/N-methyltransferase